MSRLQPIRSRNDQFQLYETLRRNREKRTHTHLFFLEGVHPVEQAIAAGERFQSIAYAEDQRTDGERRIREAFARAEAPLLVVCDRPSSPGNLGTIIRSADAFGACGVLTTGHSADFYDTQCIRASIGTVFHVPFHQLGSPADAVPFLRSLGDVQLIGTSAKGTAAFHEHDLTRPTVLLVGNETFGLSKAWKEACDALLRIPIYGAASSLNVGCAATICLYEIARQRDFDGHR